MNILDRAIACLCQLKREGRLPEEGEFWLTRDEFEELKSIAVAGGLNLTLGSAPRFAGVRLRVTDRPQLPH
jgi:hypothetical protein